MSAETKYKITITGVRDLLMCHDNIEFGERVKTWRTQNRGKPFNVPGDDRSPGWGWIGCLYHNEESVAIPSDNLMTLFREGAKRVSTGKKGATFKAQSQSDIVVDQMDWPLMVNGAPIPWAEIKAMGDNINFKDHEDLAEIIGFKLFVKRAKVGTSKHIRVRPRFQNWSCAGTVTVIDNSITKEVLQEILSQAGRLAGLGDWRPSSPKSPGPFGVFTATVEEA